MLLKLYKGIRGSLCSYQNKKVLKNFPKDLGVLKDFFSKCYPN